MICFSLFTSFLNINKYFDENVIEDAQTLTLYIITKFLGNNSWLLSRLVSSKVSQP
jgi:hypothetical protein